MPKTDAQVSDVNDTMQDIPYSLSDRVFPSLSDDDLWMSVFISIRDEYPERAIMEHIRQAFERVCGENDDYMLFKDFLRKVKLAWLWKRPPAPRGIIDLE